MWKQHATLRPPCLDTSVVAVAPQPAEHGTHNDRNEWIYELTPSQTLPILDLARTVKTEFFSSSMSRIFHVLRRHPLALLLGYLITTLSYFVIMVVPSSAGRYIAVVGVLIGLPGNFLGLGQLRYDILKLHTRTFDVWFSSIMWLAFFVILAIMFNDLRAVIVVSFWLGSWPNVCHDACLVTIRPMVFFNIICIFTCAMIVVAVNLNTTDGLRDVVLMRVGDHELSARGIVTDGFVTIAALMSRNVYRRRDIVLRRTKTRDLECVIYRCQLKFRERPTLQQRQKTVRHHHLCAFSPVAPSQADVSGHIQQMRLVPFVGGIDVRNTVIPVACKWMLSSQTHATTVVPLSAYAAIATTLCGSASMLFSQSSTDVQTGALILGCALTAFHSVMTAMLYNRRLLVVVYTSFDFAFLMFQVTSVHVCVCDLFRWQLDSVLLTATSWLWIHWVLALDALLPPLRQRLHIHRHFARLCVMCCVTAGVVLVYVCVFADPPARIVDRVIWAGTVMGGTVSFRVLSQFYSSLATVLFLSLRICWLQWWVSEEELVAIDGPVVFTNTFARVRPKALHPIAQPATG